MPSGKRLTADEINNRLRDRKITLISPFTKASESHFFRCDEPECENVWSNTVSNVAGKRSQGCAQCQGQKLSDSEIQRRIQTLLDRGIEMLDDYAGMSKDVRFKCAKDGEIWTATLSEVYNAGTGCPRCAGKIIDIEYRLSVLADRGIELLSPFTRVYKIHLFGCKKPNCGHTWTTTFDAVWRTTGCAKCDGQVLTSDEKRLAAARKLLRKRLGTRFYVGVTPRKVYRNDDGSYNDLYNGLMPYGAIEIAAYVELNPKPNSEYHLDHIVPFSWFDPDNLKEQKLCWDRRNLQWLTGSENAKKRNRIRPQDLTSLTDWHYDTIAQCSYPKPLPLLVA